MPREYGELHAADGVRYTHRVVFRCGDNTPTVGCERGGTHGTAMSGKYDDLAARGRVPDTRGLVGRSADDARAIGRPCGRPTLSRCPDSSASCVPVAASQMRTVWSNDAVTMRRPSGENSAVRTASP